MAGTNVPAKAGTDVGKFRLQFGQDLFQLEILSFAVLQFFEIGQQGVSTPAYVFDRLCGPLLQAGQFLLE